MMKNTTMKIMIAEASEIMKNNNESKFIKKNYTGTMVDSLLLNKLNKIGLKNKNGITKDLVMVDFSYGYTSNKDKQKQESINNRIEEIKELVKNNNDSKQKLSEERKLQDNNKDKKAFTNKIEELKELNRELKLESNELKIEIKELGINKEEVRKELYNNGFKLDYYKQNKETKEYAIDKTIDYVYFFRGAGTVKQGKAVFINKKLYRKVSKWQTMSIKKTNKIVEIEAYKSLTASHAESFIELDPRTEILVVNDLDSFAECNIAKVYTENGECKVKHTLDKVKNTLFDGQALLDYDFKGMKVLRQHFFKVCAFSSNIQLFIQDYCKDNGIDYDTFEITDRYGRKVLAKNIKMITTENAMKWEKFDVSYDYWCEKVAEDDNLFGVVKTDHKSKYDNVQRMSYQMINSLPINKEELSELCKDTVSYINELKDNDDSFVKYLKINANEMNSNEMYSSLYNQNKEIAKSETFRLYKSKIISKLKKDIRQGRVFVNGDNLTIVGNPYTMLQYAVGALDSYIVDNVITNWEDPTMPIISSDSKVVACYTTRFDNEFIGGFRSPHNSTNNIGYFKNIRANDLMDKYFNFTCNILAINMIKTNVQDRMNGCDMDSDFMLATNDSTVVEASRKAQEYPTIVNAIEQSSKSYGNTMDARATIDSGIAKGRFDIGSSSNLAQIAQSWYQKYQDKEYLDIAIILSVLAQVAIDTAKREFAVDTTKEINRLRNLDCMQIRLNENKELVQSNDKDLKLAKPMFLQYVKEFKEKQIDGSDKYYIEKKVKVLEKKNKDKNNFINTVTKEKVCVMDFLQDEVEKIKNKGSKCGYLPINEFVLDIKGKANTRQKSKVLELCQELKKYQVTLGYSKIFNKEKEEMEKKVEYQMNYDKILADIVKIKLGQKTMQILILEAFKNSKQYKNSLLNTLYKSNKGLFLSCFC